MIDYLTLKSIHVGCVGVSGAGFTARYLLMLRDSPLLRSRFVRVVPHVVDTVLLASAVALAWIAGFSPLRHAWLAAKIVGLVLYVVLGAVALRRGRTRPVRAVAGLAALAVFGYVVAVALTKSPLPFAGG